jgi:hypothetical protein
VPQYYQKWRKKEVVVKINLRQNELKNLKMRHTVDHTVTLRKPTFFFLFQFFDVINGLMLLKAVNKGITGKWTMQVKK